MNPAEIICRKRDGHALSPQDLAALIARYTQGSVPDYQMAAFAMAVFFRGMNADETTALTAAMLESGERLTWPDDERMRVDKHSTGGIGDKVSLVLAPLLAACDLQVPMISGRGLGPTGGTLDKLEAIPGFRTDLDLAEIQRLTQQVGCVITGATADLVPADRKLYALRDVTGTVPSIPLITAQHHEQETGRRTRRPGARRQVRLRGIHEGRAPTRDSWPQSLVNVGRQMGVATTALVTDKNQPLGRMVGNACEVDEAVAALRGEGPEDLTRLTLALGSELLQAAGVAESLEAGHVQLKRVLESGAGLEKFCEMVVAQGGDPHAPRRRGAESIVAATRSGSVAAIDGEQLGLAVIELGGGPEAADRRDRSLRRL